MTVLPKISNVNFYINGVYKTPGTYTISKSDKVGFDITISGEDGTLLESTNCLYWLIDKKTGKPLISKQFTLKPDQMFSDSVLGISINNSAELEFQTWYWENGKWVFCDKKGVWYIKIGNTGGGNTVNTPNLKIDKLSTYITVGGRNIKPPAEVKVNPGTKIYWTCPVVNKGGAGKCRVILHDSINNINIFDKTFNLPPESEGGGKILWAEFKVNKNLNLKVFTYSWDGSKWVTTDTYGSWKIEVQGQGTSPTPTPNPSPPQNPTPTPNPPSPPNNEVPPESPITPSPTTPSNNEQSSQKNNELMMYSIAVTAIAAIAIGVVLGSRLR